MARLDWRFIAREGPVAAVFGVYCAFTVVLFVANPDRLLDDNRLYFRATDAWLRGGNPWGDLGFTYPFAGPPPTLLLNLPLIPLGEDVAAVFWFVAGAVGIYSIVRRLGLPFWWLFFPPVMEGLLIGSPDMALAAIAFGRVGWIAGLTKPYAIPAMLGNGRIRVLFIAGIAFIVTIPLLPWGQFIAEWPTVSTTLTNWTAHLSAWGNPVAMGAVGLALLTLPRRIAGELVAPALWPSSQLHYAVFSFYAASRSPILAIGLSLNIGGAPVAAVILYALVELARDPDRLRRFFGTHRPRSRTCPLQTPGRSRRKSE